MDAIQTFVILAREELVLGEKVLLSICK